MAVEADEDGWYLVIGVCGRTFGVSVKNKTVRRAAGNFEGGILSASSFRLSIAIAYHDFRIFGFARAEESLLFQITLNGQS